MRFLITTGPTREYIDSVRFISNGSSGRMGCAVAAAALQAGAEVTILAGPGVGPLPDGVKVCRFISVAELQALMDEHFPICDVLVMAAAVGDFTIENPRDTKLSRHGGAVDIRLLPTPDLLGGVKPLKQPGQTVISFAVEDGEEAAMLAKAREEMILKGADYCVLNTPAAMGADASRACVLYGDRQALPWAERPKTELAAELVGLLSSR